MTINLPRFKNVNTGELVYVNLPEPSNTWTGNFQDIYPTQCPMPANCSGFVPDAFQGCLPKQISIRDDIFDDDEATDTSSNLDPNATYLTIQDTYSTDTYYNIALKKSDFLNNSQTQFLKVVLMDRQAQPEPSPDPTPDIKTYTVTFVVDSDKGNATGILEQVVEEGGAAVAPEVESTAGWIFDGWDKDFSNIVENTTVTAQFSADITYYTVAFVVDTEKATYTGDLVKQVAEGGTAIAPRVTAKSGWTFTGWDKPLGNITEDTTITAQFTAVVQPEYFYWGYRLNTDGDALDIDNLESNDVLNEMHKQQGTSFPSSFSYEYPEGTKQIFLLAPHGQWNKRIVAKDVNQGTYAFENEDLAYQNKVQVVGRDGTTMINYDLWCYLPRRAFTAPVALTFTWINN